MIKNKKYIRNLGRHIDFISDNAQFYVGVRAGDRPSGKITDAGLPKDLPIGSSILPLSLGKVSDFNAFGREVIRRDLEKETVSHQKWWTWKDWGGHEHSKVVDYPVERYPREFMPPPSVELIIGSDEESKVIYSGAYHKTTSSEDEILHAINLYLELFGSCEFYTEHLERLVAPSIRTLNWSILPKGKYPWDISKSILSDVVNISSDWDKKVIEDRFKTISSYVPDFMAIGNGGFVGYVVFGFEDTGIYILESAYINNATYVFDEGWEAFSQLTKAKILTQGVHHARIIHNKHWYRSIKSLFEAA